jgi:DNA-binding GntR family transcriptional regulator
VSENSSNHTTTRPNAEAAMTKSERAYLTIRRTVVTGEVAEGTQIDEVGLIERLGLGRTPVREALKRLAIENYIVWPPHGKPFVRVLGISDLHSIYESRLLLELPASRLAADRARAVDLDRLDDIVAAMRDAVTSGDTYRSVELDYEFHSCVAAASQNRFLAELVAAQNSHVLRLWYRARERSGLAGTVEPHAMIVGALRGKDPAKAEALARDHANRSYERQLAQYGLVGTPDSPVGAVALSDLQDHWP